MHLLRLAIVANFVYRFFKKQKQFNSHFVGAFLQPFQLQYGRSIKEATLRKINNYYCLGIPITCASYKKIYGKQLTKRERELATLTGILTPLLDDFTDEKTLSFEAIETLTSAPSMYKAATPEEAIVQSILCRLLEFVPESQGFKNACRKILDAQRLTEKQLDPQVSQQTLLTITLEKGAWSHIFFHYLLTEQPTAQTIEAMHLMGGMLQMSNDIFDVYKDHKDGIKTIPNTCRNFIHLKAYYIAGCRQFCKMARALPYQKSNIEFFITFIAFVMARGVVALNMLQQLQQRLGGGPLQIENLERKQLICDMEKPINAVKTAYYTLKIIA